MNKHEIDTVKFYKEQWREFFNSEDELEDFLLTSSFTMRFIKLNDGQICVETHIDSPYEEYVLNKANQIMEEQIEYDGNN